MSAKTLVLSLLMSAGAAFAQPFGIGIKAGIPLTDAFNVQSPNPFDYAADTRRYTVGGYVELRLPLRFSVELDGLYQPYEFRSAVPFPVQTSASSWQFPLVAKYKILPGPIKPYIEGGVAFARLTNIGEVPELDHENNFGIVAGAGIEFKLGPVRISPEIRYNNWTDRFFNSPGGYLRSNQNQATFLVGLGF